MASKRGPYEPPNIVFVYDPSAPGAALHPAQSLTMHIAGVSPGTDARVQSVPMARQSAGYWSADFKPPKPYGMGYFVFYFADGEHHVDRNHGEYWDVVKRCTGCGTD